MTDETNKILSDEEIKDKILSLDIAKECYAYYYKILYDKYLQLLKCHQSEAYYEKKSRNQTIIIRECTKYIDDQKARIKELEIKTQSCGDCDKDIRADQNKKIGNYFNKHFPTRDQMFEAIAKLQKGEL